MTSTLRLWLASRTPSELTDIIERRPDVLNPYPPDDLGELTERLHYPQSLINVLYDMPQPCLDVLAVLLVYGSGGITRDALTTIFEGTRSGHFASESAAPESAAPESATPAWESVGLDVAAVLAAGAKWAIMWEVDGRVWIPGALRTLMPTPLRLGPPVTELIAPRTADDLRSRAVALKIPVKTRKADILAALEAFYADGDAIRAVAAQAPRDQRELLNMAAWTHPVLRAHSALLYPGRTDPKIAWLIDHGLVVADWQSVIVPREVGLAIRGADWHPVLTVRPPDVPAVEANVATIDSAAAAAANTAIEQFTTVIEACGATPMALLKTGGLGVREIRRIAKVTGVPEQVTRLWLEMAYAGDIVDVDDDELVPTPMFDEWVAMPPAERLLSLVALWWNMRTVPLIDTRPEGIAAPAALAPDSYGSIAAELRCDVLTAAADLPEGSAIGPAPATSSRSADSKNVSAGVRLIEVVAWRRPLLASMVQDLATVVGAIWAEATLLGLVGRDATSSLGRAMIVTDDPAEGAADHPPRSNHLSLDQRSANRAGLNRAGLHRLGLNRAGLHRGNADRLRAVAEKFAHDQTFEAIFQADLTIVVPGSPTLAVATLLDAVADRESRGAAGTWRCSPASVRRALDSGYAAEALLDDLRAIAIGGTLPQPLEYLVADVARQHGRLRARSVGCVLRSDDPALLAEITATRSLASLRLAMLAPTVLVSALPIEATLTALRTAGYAPVGESADGTPLIERRQARRAPRSATVLPFQPTSRSARHLAGGDRFDHAEYEYAEPEDDEQLDDEDLEELSFGELGFEEQDDVAFNKVRRRYVQSGRDPRLVDPADLAHELLATEAKVAEAANRPAKTSPVRTGPAKTTTKTATAKPALRPITTRPPDQTVPRPVGSRPAGSESAGELPDAPIRIPTLRKVQRSAPHLSPDEQRLLTQAIDNGREIQIGYHDLNEEYTSRLIEPIELDGSVVVAWCYLRNDERNFALSRIQDVEPPNSAGTKKPARPKP